MFSIRSQQAKSPGTNGEGEQQIHCPEWMPKFMNRCVPTNLLWKDFYIFVFKLISVTMDPWLYYVPEINTSDAKHQLVLNYKLALLLLIPYSIFFISRIIIFVFCTPSKDRKIKWWFYQLATQSGPGLTAFVSLDLQPQ